MKKSLTIIMVISFLLLLNGCGSGTDDTYSSNESELSSKSEEATYEDYSDVETTWDLGQGFYTAGIDIPAGTCDITATSGIGYISSTYNSANLRSPEYSEDEFDDYDSSFKSFSINDGDCVEVRGVSVKLVYSKVNSSVAAREYDEALGIHLSPGNYVVGTDLEPGRYCIKYISGGGGFVSSDSGDLGFNMDGDSTTGEYVDYVSNVEIKKGESIEVTSGLTVLFIPEK